MNTPANIKPIQSWSSFDRRIMSLALQLAKKGQYTARPNPMVGCVLVDESSAEPSIIARGWHQKSGQPHAEINALAQAGEKARGATCYVSLEPCAHTGKTGPCASALVKAGVSKVIAAMQDPNPQVAGRGFQILIDAGIEVKYGLMESQAQQLNRGFVSRYTRQRPWLTCKLAMSLDGRTALADGSSRWITGTEARLDVQKLRARQDAIITGAGTLLADNPSLNVRPLDGANDQLNQWFYQAQQWGFSQPARILLDRQGQATPDAKLFNPDAEVYRIGRQADVNLAEQSKDQPLHRLNDFTSLSQMLEHFGALGMNNLLLESGHRLAGEFLKQGLIDELVVYMAPKLMGNRAMGLFDLEVTDMHKTPQFELTDLRQLGKDIRLTYTPEK